MARSRSLDVGGATSAGSPIASVPDEQVDDVANETGTTIDGMLGGSFLRAYYTVVDYAGGKLSLYPYASGDPLADEFDRAGVFLVESDGGYDVGQAIDPTADALLDAPLDAIDGTALVGLDPEQADRSLRGSLGTTHTLRAGAQTVTLAVKDVLPL